MNFRRDDHVEVVSNEEGFMGSYYKATACAIGQIRKGYMVEYHTLLKDDLSRPLTEVVFAAKVCPPPPKVPVTEFKLHDLVDAFDNEGWWVGKIWSMLSTNSSSKDEFVYDFKRLTLLQDWIKGKWVLPKNHHHQIKKEVLLG